jgi:hypothetical protein
LFVLRVGGSEVSPLRSIHFAGICGNLNAQYGREVDVHFTMMAVDPPLHPGRP